MKLSTCLGGEADSVENGISRRTIGLPLDPFLDPGQAFGRLMDIVSVGDVGKRLKQLFEALASSGRKGRGRPRGTAARSVERSLRFSGLSHPTASPSGLLAQTRTGEIDPLYATFH